MARAISLKHFLDASFNDPDSRIFPWVNDILAFVTIVSIVSLVLETVPALSPYYPHLLAIEWITVAIFSLEYVGRVVAAKKKVSYIFSFFGILDLLSILPSFIGLANLTFLKTARTIRILRFLRVLRLAKLARAESLHGSKKEQSMGDIVRLNLGIYTTAIVGCVLILGGLIYLVEGHTIAAFQSIPHGMLWALQILFSVPFTPVQTAPGMFVFVGVKILAILLFGAFTGLVGTIVQGTLLGQLSKKKKK